MAFPAYKLAVGAAGLLVAGFFAFTASLYAGDLRDQAARNADPACASGASPNRRPGVRCSGCAGEYAQRDPSQLPKLVLLDLKMPKVNGLDVLRELKSNERTRSIPVVVMTSSNEDRDVVESYQLGTNAYVVKPVDFPSFTEAVVRLGMFWLLVNKAP